jgi:hypothetical protein
MRRVLGCLVTLLSMASLVGCGSNSKPSHPRTFREIDDERRALPALYVTVKGKTSIAPGDSLPFSDKETHDICFPAYHCLNPNCPAKDQIKDGHPFVFGHVDPLLRVGPNGELSQIELRQGTDVSKERQRLGGYDVPTCPECWKTRNRSSEKEADRQKYQSWVKPYTLPETAQRIKELDAEEVVWNEYLIKLKNRPLPEGTEKETKK